MTGGPGRDADVPLVQRLFENIWFLLLIGTIIPTVFYTAWSLIDLVILPQFQP